MTDPFRYGKARVSIDGLAIDATNVQIERPAIFDDSPSGIRRRMERQLAPVSVRVAPRATDGRSLLRELKGIHAKLHDLADPVRIPSAQEIVMRQELGEFDV